MGSIQEGIHRGWSRGMSSGAVPGGFRGQAALEGVSTWIPDVPSSGTTEHLGTGCEPRLGSEVGQRECWASLGRPAVDFQAQAAPDPAVSPFPRANTGKVPPTQESPFFSLG